MSEGVPESIPPRESHREGVPEDVFKAWYEWNLRFPQNTLGFQSAILARALEHVDPEAVMNARLSNEQIEKALSAARAAHSARDVSNHMFEDEELAREQIENLWNGIAHISRQLVWSLQSDRHINENEFFTRDSQSIDLSTEDREKLRYFFSEVEEVLRLPEVEVLLDEYRNSFGPKQQEHDGKKRPSTEIFDDILARVVEQLHMRAESGDERVPPELVERFKAVVKLAT